MKIASIILVFAMLLSMVGCSKQPGKETAVQTTAALTASGNSTTVMVYMVGSDLEAKGAAGTKDMEEMLESGISLENNNAVFILVLHLCTAYEHKAFIDGLQYGAHLILELNK